jgi:hypothetical protein
MRWLLICLAIAGCAKAGKENTIIGGVIDAGTRGDGLDALPDDASLQQTTLTQTASDAVAMGASLFNCHGSSTGFIFENSYYRVFALADDGIATTLHVTQVDFGIDTAIAGIGGKQPGTIRIGAYGGALGGTTLDLSLVRAINSADIQIPDGSATKMTVPITADIAATASILVELFIPDGRTDGNKFKIGANAGGERKPSYVRGPDCGTSDPTTLKSLSPGDEIDLILTVTGMTETPS